MKKLIAGLLLIVLTSTVCFAETFFWEDKKGINTTEEVSKLPPKFREKYEDYIKQHLKKTIPESANNAIRALRKLEARCEAGISPRDYGPALSDAKFDVSTFENSKEVKDWVALKEGIMRTMALYQKAGDSMRQKLATAELSRLSGNEVMALKSNNAYDDIVVQYFKAASNGLNSIDRLIDIFLTKEGMPYPPGAIGSTMSQ